MKNTDRDTEIIRRYVSGEPIEVIQSSYGITRSRVYQILRAAGVDRNRQPMQDEVTERDTFLGVNISKDVKEALRAEVQRRRALGEEISMSSLSHVMLRDMLTVLGYPLEAELVTEEQK